MHNCLKRNLYKEIPGRKFMMTKSSNLAKESYVVDICLGRLIEAIQMDSNGVCLFWKKTLDMSNVYKICCKCFRGAGMCI